MKSNLYYNAATLNVILLELLNTFIPISTFLNRAVLLYMTMIALSQQLAKKELHAWTKLLASTSAHEHCVNLQNSVNLDKNIVKIQQNGSI